MDSPQDIVVVEQLVKQFGDVTAVDHIDFTVGRGLIVALLGGNGAGKTTTISMLLGLTLPTSGHISVFGCNMDNDRHKALPRMNFSSPYVELPYRLTVAENLRVYAMMYGLANINERLNELAEDLDMSALVDKRCGKLSAGQKTRVTLAKALLNEPELLLLDEPTASLDPDTADWVRTYLENYRKRTGATILLASHNMAEVERMCDDVLMMRAGTIVSRGSPEFLIRRYGRQNMEEVFLDIARNRRTPRDDDHTATPAPEGETIKDGVTL